MFANMFLAARSVCHDSPVKINWIFIRISSIYALTKSRIQSGLVVLFSVIAYVLGTITLMVTWKTTWFGCFHTTNLGPY
jgi:hypothetical protein